MSILMGLFGRSKDRKRPAVARCMDCGMMDGKHTTWCPTASQADAAAVAPVDTLTTTPASQVDTPTDGSEDKAHPT